MAMKSGISVKAAANPADSVRAEASGISERRKAMFAMIVRRSSTARSALTTVIITSWKGTTAQARVRPAAAPCRLSTTVTSRR